MLYLLYFLLRDGAELSKTVREALPLARPHTHYLLNKFTTVIRATVKGNVAVAAVQGAHRRPGLLVPGRAGRAAVGAC